MTIKCHSLIIFVLIIYLFKINILFASEIRNSLNTFGVPGLIDIPTAGPLDDGEMSVSVSKFGSNLRNTLSFQALPNIFGSFRYSGVGDRDTGFYSSGANKIAFTAGGTERLEANTSGVNVSGILSATSISLSGGDPLTAVAKVGLGTPVDPTSTEGLDVVYYTDRSVALGGTVTVPASADVAYTPYGDVVVNSGEEFTISEGDQFLADVLGIGSLGTGMNTPGGVIRADVFTARMGNAPIFPSGLKAEVGVVTSLAGFDGDIVSTAATITTLNVTNLVGGGTEWTLGADGTNNYTFSGPGFTGAENDPTITLIRGQEYKFVNNMGAHPFRIQSTPNGSAGTPYNDGVTNNDVSSGTLTWDVQFDAPDILWYQCTAHANMGGIIYIIDAGVGISSAGGSIATNATNLNFIGAGNTFLFNSTTNTVDISIAGGGGGGGGGDGKTTFFASGYGGSTARSR